MSTLTIYRDGYADATVISNRFIDVYMKDANDAQLKVYLYLVRMMSANLPTSVSDIADCFNHTEKDVLRALKYWEKCNLLTLEYNEQKALCGIHFTSPDTVPAQNVPERPMAQIVPIKLSTVNNSTEKAVDYTANESKESIRVNGIKNDVESLKEDASAKAESIPTYSREQLKAFKNAPETGQLLFIAEQYLKHTLTLTDIQTIYFIYDELSFSEELIDYLLQYCVLHGKDSFHYIRKVAISWAEAGITTPKQAKAFAGNKYDKNVYAIMKSLGKNGSPTPKEVEFINRWSKEYSFSMDIISEACDRTVIATDNHRFEYCEKILAGWKNAGVRYMNDIAVADASFKKSKSATSTNKNMFNRFQQNSYDFDELERDLLSN